MTVRLSALRAGRALLPQWFLVLISIRSWIEPRDISQLEGLGQLKKCNNHIGNRTRDLPVCSLLPGGDALGFCFGHASDKTLTWLRLSVAFLNASSYGGIVPPSSLSSHRQTLHNGGTKLSSIAVMFLSRDREVLGWNLGRGTGSTS
jgi:hypothetical protein